MSDQPTTTRRSRLDRLAYLLSGLGLLGALAAFTLWSGQDAAGEIALTEDQLFDGRPESYLDASQAAARSDLPRIGFRPLAIEATFHGLGEPLSMHAQLALDDGRAVRLTRGQPLAIAGARLSLERVGVAPCFVTVDARNGDLVDEPFCVNLDIWTPTSDVDSFVLGSTQTTLRVRLFPDYEETPQGPRTRSMQLRHPVIEIEFTPSGADAPIKQWLQVEHAMIVDGLHLRLVELRTWGLFRVVHPKSPVWLIGAVAILLLGLGLGLLARVRARRDAPPPADTSAVASARPVREATLLVFLASFLLFTAEPLVGRLVLPQLGGGFQIWTTSLMFFQGLLFVSYLYCAAFGRRLGRYHLVLVVLPLLALPLEVIVDGDSTAPWLSLLRALLPVAAPLGVLGTTSVIIQRWVSRSETPGAANPYPLYAASNAGALLALLLYPFAIDPFFGLRAQRLGWSVGYLLYVGVAFLAARRLRPTAEAPARPSAADARPSLPQQLGWFLLAAAPSALLLSVTNVITVDLGAVPLLWVAPLGLYLGTFVLAFRERDRAPYLLRRFWPELSLIAMLFHGAGVFSKSTPMVVVLHLTALFAVSLAAHRALYLRRPAAAYLERFYLVIAAGGWLGGALVSLGAPRWFSWTAEYPLSLAAAAAAIAFARRRELFGWLRRESPIVLLGTIAIAVIAVMGTHGRYRATKRFTAVHRNFYGIYRVSEQGGVRTLRHGTTDHGRQLLDPEGRRRPIGYYDPASPLGDIMALAARPRRVGVIGLGVGAAAAYLEPDEEMTFFEIDPDVIALARRHFTYLDDSRGSVRMVVGDARLALQRDRTLDGALSVLLVDAFSSDAVPTHLLTREAIQLYLRKLRPGGYLLFHTSSRHHDLDAVILATGASLGLAGAVKERTYFTADDEDPNSYAVLVADPSLLEALAARSWRLGAPAAAASTTPWTDDHANLLGSLLQRMLSPR